MGTVGISELIIVSLIVLVLFSPTIIAFWLGYIVGRSRQNAEKPSRVSSPERATDTEQTHEPGDEPAKEPAHE